MVDEIQNSTTGTEEAEAPPIPADAPEADHPHSGVPEEGWSAPVCPVDGQVGFAKLVVKRAGVETDLEFPVAPPAIIGRFDPSVGPIDVDLAGLAPEGSYVSRKHAKIVCDEGKWLLCDMGSSNGTFLLRGNDFERVEEAELSDGDEIALGNARFVFHLQQPVPAAADPQS